MVGVSRSLRATAQVGPFLPRTEIPLPSRLTSLRLDHPSGGIVDPMTLTARGGGRACRRRADDR